MTKTNVMRLIEQSKIPYRTAEYAYDEHDLSGMHAAQAVGMPPEQVFKTLVARGEKQGYLVFCIPVCCELDLKKAAKAAQDKKVEMVHVKELLGLTGYIRGGCSPIGMKKAFRTFIHRSAQEQDKICFSAGKVGYQVELPLSDLRRAVPVETADLIVEA